MSLSTHQGRLTPASTQDIPILIEFIQKMALESEDVSLPTETLSKGVQAMFDHPERGQYWVWRNLDKEPIACCMITSEWSDWHNRFYYWLQSVYLIPEARGTGHLQAFLNSLCQELKEKQGHELRLYVDHENKRAQQAYLKASFEASHYALMTRRL